MNSRQVYVACPHCKTGLGTVKPHLTSQTECPKCGYFIGFEKLIKYFSCETRMKPVNKFKKFSGFNAYRGKR